MNCDHNWVVFSTALMPPTIMVECAECGAYGGVLDHTLEEWNLAFYAPSMPFRWADDSRVILLDDLPEPTPDDMRRLDDFLNGATVVASDESETMGATLWLTSGQTSLDGDPLLDDEYEYEVAPMISDLVNALFLFEGDNDDIPF